jgi:hypothetical protein
MCAFYQSIDNKLISLKVASKDEVAGKKRNAGKGAYEVTKIESVKKDFQETLEDDQEFCQIIASLDKFVVIDVRRIFYRENYKRSVLYIYKAVLFLSANANT